MSISRTIRLSGAMAVLVVALAACGSDAGHNGQHNEASASPSAVTSGNHNAADVAFAREMIPHHRQAVEMADLATTRAGDARVKQLAQRIQQTQQPEIDKMSEWLASWGEPVPSSSGHNGHGSMPGMMDADEMAALMKASGAEFDRMFLEMMIKHHQGAIEMARTEQRDGAFGPAKELAATIAKSQTAEIAEMESLLSQL